MQDSKGLLQEVLQKNGGETPTYRITGTSGPPHAPIFEAAVYRGSEMIGTGTGKTKKQAEQAAAVRALENLKAEEG
jgi:ribonuclease-3